MNARRCHRSYPPELPHEIALDDAETVVTLLEDAIARHAPQQAVSCLGDSYRYADIGSLSQAFADYLQVTGLRPGDRVAIMLPSCAPFVIALAGVLRASMTVVTINPLYTPREVEQQLVDSGASLVVAAQSAVPAVLGAHNRLVPNPRDLASVIAELKRGPFAMFIGVNTLFNALVDVPELASVDFSATRLVTGAGASVQSAVARRWEAAGGPPITEGYGLTETSPSATFNPPGRNGSIGIPVPSTDARIVDDDGCDVPVGAPGELLLRGPQLFDGYSQRPDETESAFTADGWFKTGDVVTMDEAGFMVMVDRKKDMILVSGFNVYPNEIEGVVAAMPEVVECACIGVADSRSGEVPHLFVVPRSASLVASQVEAHCRTNLAAYKVPRHITFVEALPKSTVGKILRRELRKSRGGSDVAAA